MRGISRLLVVVVSAVTLLVVLAIGASATSSGFGPSRAFVSAASHLGERLGGNAAQSDKNASKHDDGNGKDKDKDKDKCDNEGHHHGTPGHENCPDEDHDNDNHEGGDGGGGNSGGGV